MTDGRWQLSESVLNSLRASMRGRVLDPDSPGFDEARKIWNGRFDRNPAAIARCAGTDDVAAALEIARRNELLISVRSGGHDYAGKSVSDGALVIDLSLMNEVTVDADSKRARVQAGVRWGAFDQEAQRHGLATTGGTVSTVGVAGYTLGGGTGWLSRKHGLGLDNLLSAEVVLASGEIVRASRSENDDLFWALRGGSGNFGIVTSFEFQLHEVGPEVVAGQILHPLESAPDVLRFYRSFMTEAPDELQCYPFFLRVPPLDIFPEQYHGQVAIDLVVSCTGEASEAEAAIRPLQDFGEPFFSGVGPQQYTALQQSFDAGMPSGNRWYSKAHYLRELSDDGIEILIRHVSDMPGSFTVVYMEPGGGAVGRVDAAETAFPHREAAYSLHIFPGWQQAADDERMIEWARTFHRDMAGDSTGGAYVNLLNGDENDVARTAWGANYERLREVKQKYDPDNLFRRNHNIEPAGRSRAGEGA